MPKETKTKTLFSLKEMDKAADGNGHLYCGYVGGYELGCVMAKNQTEAKKKLLTIARKLLK